MEILDKLITDDKINNIIDNLKILKLHPTNVSDRDYIDSITDSIEDIINNPYSITLPSAVEITEMDEPSALPTMEIATDTMIVSEYLDKSIRAMGNKLNKQIENIEDFSDEVESLLETQINRLIATETVMFDTANNASIHDSVIFKKNDSSVFDGNIIFNPYIRLLPSKISKLKPILFKTNEQTIDVINYKIDNFQVNVTNIDNTNDELKIDFDDIYGKSDDAIFKNKYFNGRTQPTLEYGTPYHQDNINNLFDDSISWAEWENVDFSNDSDAIKEFKVRITFNIIGTDSPELIFKSLSGANEKVSILFDKTNESIPENVKNKWITIEPAYHKMQDNELSKVQLDERYYHIPTYNSELIKMEIVYTTSNFEILDTPRYVIAIDDIKKSLNLIETYLFAISGITDSNINSLFEENSFDDLIQFTIDKNSKIDNNFRFIKDSTLSNIEYKKFKRYSISLFNFELSEVQYEQNSAEYISDIFESKYPIKTLDLFVNTKTNSIDINSDVNYFKYYISPDKINWYEIQPQDQTLNMDNFTIPTRIIYNDLFDADNSSETITTEYGNQVYLKVTIDKNSEEASPILSDYQILAKV